MRVVLGGVVIVDTLDALRVLETSLPPSFYIARERVLEGSLKPAGGRPTVCEWKGVATYFDVVAGGARAARAAWSYHDPSQLRGDPRRGGVLPEQGRRFR